MESHPLHARPTAAAVRRAGNPVIKQKWAYGALGKRGPRRHPPEAMIAVSVASSSTASVGSMNTCAAQQGKQQRMRQHKQQSRGEQGSSGQWQHAQPHHAAGCRGCRKRRRPHRPRCMQRARPGRRCCHAQLTMSMGVIALRAVLCVRSKAPLMMATSSAQGSSRARGLNSGTTDVHAASDMQCQGAPRGLQGRSVAFASSSGQSRLLRRGRGGSADACSHPPTAAHQTPAHSPLPAALTC